MDLKIIQLGIIHLNACIDIDKKSFKGLSTKSQWERELTDPKRFCIGAMDDETKELLGVYSAWLVIDELQLVLIAVHPSHQCKGLGKVLLSDLIKRSKLLRTKFIHLEVKDTNEPAKALYKSMGFKIKGNRTNFYKDGSDAILFVKELTKNSKKNN